jgi:outer membrane protein TolC
VALSSVVAAALAGAEEGLTLAQALEMAQRQNPELQAGSERAQAQAERADATRRSGWPRLSAATGWTLSNDPAQVFAQKLGAAEFTADDFALASLNSPAALSHLTTTLGVQVPIDLFHRVRTQAGAQSALQRMAIAGLEEGRSELRLRVVTAYWQTALAQRALVVHEKALQGAQAREAGIAERVAQGAALQADLLRTRARRRQREAELAARRGDARSAAALLSRLLGTAAGVVYRPTDPLPVPAPITSGDAPPGVRRASIVMAGQRLEAARAGLQGEQQAGLPEIVVYGHVQDDRNTIGHGSRSGVVGASLRWNAFDRARGKRQAAAAAELRAAEQDVRAAADQARLEVEMAWRQAQAARERYSAAAGGAEDGREALRVTAERRQAGMATLTDELETEAASLTAELEEVQAAIQVAVADAALERAVGDETPKTEAER